MFSVFSKNKNVIDLIQDQVDIHNHILPGIDDGAKTVDDSYELIKRLVEVGYSSFICTPHTMNEFYPNTPHTIKEAKDTLTQFLATTEFKDLSIGYSSEYMMDGTFLELLKDDTIIPLKENYVLVEMSYLQPPINLEEILYEITNAGYIPVLAHPERYNYLHEKYVYYKRLKELGCRFQLNLLSLSQHYGSSVKKITLKLLEDGLYNFIGTDTHHKGHINLLKQIKLNKKTFNAVEGLSKETKGLFGS